MPSNILLSIKTLFKSTNVLQLKDIFQIEVAKFMLKASRNDLPHDLSQFFSTQYLPYTDIKLIRAGKAFSINLRQTRLFTTIVFIGIFFGELIDPKLKIVS